MIEEILHNGRLLALILRVGFRTEGIRFFTPDDFSQQLGYMNRPGGYVIPPHVHNPVQRSVHYTKEVLFIKSGRVRVDFYDDAQNYLESRIVAAGDVPRCKPDPAGFLAAHAAFNRHRPQKPIVPRACVVIEDSLPGLAAAGAAGMPCVMLATSHAPEMLRQRGAALVWQSLSGHTAAELGEL